MNFEALKYEASISPNKRSRIIYTPGFDMVICLHKSSVVGMHRHPKFEAYHLIEGVLLVQGIDDPLYLTIERPMIQISPGVWHEPRAVTEFAIYREFYAGPFDKIRDVEYYKPLKVVA